MTKEEIEALVEEEVSRRVATLAAQFGRDLSERYPTREEVEDTLKERLRKEIDELDRSVGEWIGEMHTADPEDPDHPLSFLVKVLSDITDLQLRVMEIGIYVLAKEAKIERGPGALERMGRLASVTSTSRDRLREHFQQDVQSFKNRSTDSEAVRAIEQLEELLVREPEPTPKTKPN